MWICPRKRGARGSEAEQKVGFGCAEFEMSFRHPRRDIGWAIARMRRSSGERTGLKTENWSRESETGESVGDRVRETGESVGDRGLGHCSRKERGQVGGQPAGCGLLEAK